MTDLILEDRSRRTDTFGWQLLTRDRSPTGLTLQPVAGATLTASTNGPGRVVRGLEVPADTAAEIDPARHLFYPTYTDDDDTVWPLGVFRAASAAVDDRGLLVVYDLVDESIRFGSKIHKPQTWPRHYPVADALTEWAADMGVLSVLIDPTLDTLGEPVSFPTGEATWGEVGEALTDAAGMLPPHYSNDGTLRCRLSPSWTAGLADHYYRVSDDRVIAGGYSTSQTFLETPNVWYTVNDSPSGAGVRGRWALPPEAPNSVEAIGYEVPEFITGAYRTPAAAAAAAERAGRTAFAQIGEATIDTVFDPRHDLYDVVDLDGTRWREVQWSVDLQAGAPHRHELRRVW